MSSIHVGSLFDELEKIAVGGLPAGLSMGGLAGLTGLEAHGAMDKKKSTKERVKSGLGAASTGAILAGEAVANKDMFKKGLESAKNLLMKRAAAMPAPKMMAMHRMADSAKAARPVQKMMPQSPESYQPIAHTDKTPSGLELASRPQMAQRSQQMAQKVMARPAVSPGAAARAPGVMGRIGNFFKGV